MYCPLPPTNSHLGHCLIHLSTAHCVLCTVHCVLCTVYCVLYTMHSKRYTVHCALSTFNCTQYSGHCAHCALYMIPQEHTLPLPPVSLLTPLNPQLLEMFPMQVSTLSLHYTTPQCRALNFSLVHRSALHYSALYDTSTIQGK